MTIEHRELNIELRQDADDRTVIGVAVPWDQTIDLGGYRERFKRGAIQPNDTADAILLYGHKDPIGKVIRGADTEAGYVIEARISDTEKGNEVRTLLRDGVLTKFSIGFEPVEDERDNDGTVVRSRVKFREASIVPFPAYDQAKVLAVREEPEPQKEESETPMEETPMPAADDTALVEVREQVADLERRLAATVTAPAMTSHPASQFRSLGEWVAAVARGDETAVELHRAFAGGVAGATVANPDPISNDQWVSESVQLLDFGRPTLNAFRRQALPSEGMNIEWPEVSTNAMAVAEQAQEADALTFGKITLTSKTSPVKTFGGYTAMSRQAVERSSFGYLDVAMRALIIAYAKATNAQVITDLGNLAGKGTATAAATAAGWFDAISDAAISIYTNTGLRPDTIVAAPNVWKKIVTLFDGQDRPLVAAGNPMNNAGSGSLVGMTANIGGLSVTVDPALNAGTCYIANSNAFTTFESPGAPFRLTDEDNVVLTKDFSTYGYMATAGQTPAGIVVVTVS